MKTYHNISEIFYYDKFLFLLNGNDAMIYFPKFFNVYNVDIWNRFDNKEKQGYIYVKQFPKNIAERLMK